MMSERDWLVVAPWWAWHASVTDTAKGRLSRPILQKYESPNLVNDFLKDPQRCLKFLDDDIVHTAEKATLPAPGGTRRLSEYDWVKDQFSTRKIFLDSHRRFYLVICAVHCDAPGFPRATRDKVCEAGFVVRRRTTDIPTGGLKEVSGILKRINSAETELAKLGAEAVDLPSRTGSSSALAAAALAEARGKAIALRRQSTRSSLAAARARFSEWVVRFGVAPQLQGWFSSPEGHDKIGAWEPVDEAPREVGRELTFPMYPLIPDPNDKGHAGHFGTVYFGVLPTGGSDTDSRGNARFDDQSLYEVSCFIKRHKDPHLKGSPCKCPDRVFWSAPTDPHQLASHFDLVGTSHRPVTVQLPDIRALGAQSKPALGLGFKKPAGSLMVKSNKQGVPQSSSSLSTDFEICFIPIPLITIVAMFVFELFLPVVVFLFQLFFLLKLKFCIPPKVSLDAQATLRIKIETALNAGLSLDPAVLLEAENNLDEMLALDSSLTTELQNSCSPEALAQMEVDIGDAVAAVATGVSASSAAPSLTADLQWETEVKYG